MTTLSQVTPIPISDLPSATTLTGNEATAIVQNNQTVQTPISSYPQGMTAGVLVYGNTGGAPFPNYRTLKAGDGVTLSDSGAQGDLTVSVTSGSGNAPANASYVVVSLTSALSQERALAVNSTLSLTDGGPNSNITLGLNTLSGTWNPSLSFVVPGDLSVVYSERIGRYTKIGKLVTIDYSIITSTFTHTTSSGAAFISALPFAAAAIGYGMGNVAWQGITKANYTDICTQIGPSGSTVEFIISGSAQNTTNVIASDMPSAGTVLLRGSLTYPTSS